ncbi:DUF6691 family protein [Robertkochia solimangrovi]|uniref:DUF6691 family protein n=1 Tax=Robertkochia solimangrovi TaxID=2213046 RepID=UPI001181254D|nr:DUF6691 family protein [Robertkochia solimangrovi]TRZ41682.1 YeeE/YedE family protein [Robertkochia solimangrovi]
MKQLKFLLTGIFFGIVLYKSEAISWYRIYEMFRFESFHMYGIIGSAVVTGVLLVLLIKRTHMHSTEGREIAFTDKDKSYARYILGGTFFGLGWALIGACPGPLFILLGTGVTTIIIAILAAMLGTFVYGLLKNKLPH